MSTAELKIDLITQIASITDKARLKELLQILNFESDRSVYITSTDEKEAISNARTQIAEGDFVTHHDFQKEIQKCLNK